MPSCRFLVFAIVALAIVPNIQVVIGLSCLKGRAGNEPSGWNLKRFSPFETALETLQKQIGYTFQSSELLRRAMTHSSFSKENNRALSILGASVVDTSVALRLIKKDIEISPKDLNRRISEISNVESSCAVDAMRLGLQKVVRVSPKTNSTTPTVVCGAFRAIFGAIAIDTGKSDEAGKIFLNVHGSEVGSALAF